MARNEEKQLGGLNRMLLAKQRRNELHHKPKRPKLEAINSSQEIRKWLPSISNDIEFYLAQSKVGCYPERKIQEFNQKINQLKWEHRKYVQKLREIDPESKIIPWTERSYDKKKSEGEGFLHSSVIENSGKDASGDGESDKSMQFERIHLPILEGSTEQLYKEDGELRKIADCSHANTTPIPKFKDSVFCEGEGSNIKEKRSQINEVIKFVSSTNDKFSSEVQRSPIAKQKIVKVTPSDSTVPVYVDTGNGYYNDSPLSFTVSNSSTQDDHASRDQFASQENTTIPCMCSHSKVNILTTVTGTTTQDSQCNINGQVKKKNTEYRSKCQSRNNICAIVDYSHSDDSSSE